MAKQVSKTVIGGFMVSAMVLLVVGVLIFGSGKFLQKTYPFVLFFDGSVKGLKSGSPVVFRGVKVGSVEKIVIRPNPQTLDVQIPVIINIDPENVEISEKRIKKNPHKYIPKLIDKGLRAQLSLESLVTGQLMIELDFHPNKPARRVGLDLGYPEIPTIPTAFDDLAQTLKKIPIEEIFEKLQSAIEGIEKVLTAPELMETIRSLNLAVQNANKLINHGDKLVNDADKLVVNIDRQVAPLSRSFQDTANDAQVLVKNIDNQIQPVVDRLKNALEPIRSVLEQSEKTLATYDNLVGERSELRYKVNGSLDEISAAARSLRALTDYLGQHPDSLLRGKSGAGGN
jgi:paraquat-inducible protein B